MRAQTPRRGRDPRGGTQGQLSVLCEPRRGGSGRHVCRKCVYMTTRVRFCREQSFKNHQTSGTSSKSRVSCTKGQAHTCFARVSCGTAPTHCVLCHTGPSRWPKLGKSHARTFRHMLGPLLQEIPPLQGRHGLVQASDTMECPQRPSGDELGETCPAT